MRFAGERTLIQNHGTKRRVLKFPCVSSPFQVASRAVEMKLLVEAEEEGGAFNLGKHVFLLVSGNEIYYTSAFD